ncbi:MAG: DUF58 domain-containing protein [archaeon]
MIKTDFLTQLKRFQIIINKRVTSSFSGTRKSMSFGRGLIVNDRRAYTPGDDYRAIDWKLYARTDAFFVKRYEEDKNLTSHLLLDSSKSMDYSTSDHTKFEYGAMLALGFAYMSARNNEKFHLSLMSEGTDPLKAKKSSNQVLTFMNHLNKAKLKGKLDFAKELIRYKSHIKSKSLVVIISDFLFDIQQVRDTLYLFKNHDLKVIQVLDKSEMLFRVYGSLIVEDSETGEKIETFLDEQKRQEYRNEMYEHITKLEEETMSLGGKFFLFSTEEPIFDAFYKVMNN